MSMYSDRCLGPAQSLAFNTGVLIGLRGNQICVSFSQYGSLQQFKTFFSRAVFSSSREVNEIHFYLNDDSPMLSVEEVLSFFAVFPPYCRFTLLISEHTAVDYSLIVGLVSAGINLGLVLERDFHISEVWWREYIQIVSTTPEGLNRVYSDFCSGEREVGVRLKKLGNFVDDFLSRNHVGLVLRARSTNSIKCFQNSPVPIGIFDLSDF